ncbi:phosphatase PAP2 family protein [Rhodanobacter sp. DHG33]|uniref:acid phosphatase n=1 Tax=Rhodanobacter sp. DHG33 TaxID=2775921 RepID=UPI001783B629|nr:phosphatase PAP2 family protein [Rhodanobacter sp. DHG33]MBD8897540.1 phosphatase PAP2 family protein [Rhodanobacter sp. DHG33]
MKRTLLLLSLLLAGPNALAADGNKAPPPVELSNLLPPPPAAGSAEARHDLDAVLATQHARTAADAAAAKADAERSVFRFADALGPDLQADRLPRTAAFFKRVASLDKAEVKQAKNYWQRPRPAAVSAQVQPLAAEKPNDWSYPSGHSTFGYTAAVLLANMLPEKRAAIFARADIYAQHRIVMGAHFPSDVEAGRLAGTVLGGHVLDDPSWQADYAAARAELRKALALPETPAM